MSAPYDGVVCVYDPLESLKGFSTNQTHFMQEGGEIGARYLCCQYTICTLVQMLDGYSTKIALRSTHHDFPSKQAV